jgi:hypothetical protein
MNPTARWLVTPAICKSVSAYSFSLLLRKHGLRLVARGPSERR